VRLRFIDCHSHVVPSGDDGAQTLDEGLELCELAAAAGTEILFATPHVWPHLTLTAAREAQIRDTFAELRERAPLDLRLGFELTPAPPLLRDDPERYALQGTNIVLVEIPFAGLPDEFLALAQHVEQAGLLPLVAHPERTEAVRARPDVAREAAARGWPLQVNATSLLGRHGPEAESLAWRLLERGYASIVASDGHRVTRPPRLDEAFELVRGRVGEEAALPLFDGSPLGLRASRLRLPSPAAAPGA
jgi:protein-tyrosine phosphatase